jgi:hypothetical protein
VTIKYLIVAGFKNPQFSDALQRSPTPYPMVFILVVQWSYPIFNGFIMVDEKNGGLTPYIETEAYAEVGHYGATVVSPGFKSSYGTFTCKGI